MLASILAIFCQIITVTPIEQPIDTTEDIIPAEFLDSLTTIEDSQAEESLFTPSEYDLKLVEWSLSWLDTTTCTSQVDTTFIPDSVYINRLSSLPREMEMTYNRYVRTQIERYTRRSPKQLAMLRRLSTYYFPIFEDALHRHGLPNELKYLPIIESALNVNAHSRMGAAGLWQFMVATGKLCGLEVNSLVDERYDPYKATEAACRFLKSLYSIYHDWTLVIAAYNCGPGNVNKAMHRSGGKHDFWDIFEYLPRETRSYVPIFVAANYALNYADEHNICTAPLNEMTQPTDTVHTTTRLHLMQVSEILNIPLPYLRRLNPQYTKDVLPGGKSYSLVLPLDKTGGFITLKDTILSYKADSLINNRRAAIELAQKTNVDGSYRNGNITYHKIKKGDTLSGIAKRYHCTVVQLQKWNGLKGTNIQIGKTLKIKR